MNWAGQFLRHTPGVQPWVAAPWMVRNEWFCPDFRFFVRDFQRKAGFLPVNEWQYNWLATNLIRLEKRWPLYKNWLARQLRQHRPDVLHAHFGPVGCHYLDLAQALDIPLVVSFYGFDFLRVPFEKPAYQQRYRQLFAQAAAMTTTGPFTPKLLEDQGGTTDKITPIPLSVELGQWPFSHRTKRPGRLKMVQVATITEKKGHLDTLEALRLSVAHCPNIHLTLVGERQDKKLVQTLAEFIRVYQLENYVTWLPAMEHRQLPGFLAEFEVFIHPSRVSSRKDSEGAPVAILEAQATGLPIIATCHADIPAAVIHHQTGWLTPENDPVALARSIEQAYWMDDREYQQMSLNARQHMTARFDIHTNAPKLLQLYQNITTHYTKK